MISAVSDDDDDDDDDEEEGDVVDVDVEIDDDDDENDEDGSSFSTQNLIASPTRANTSAACVAALLAPFFLDADTPPATPSMAASASLLGSSNTSEQVLPATRTRGTDLLSVTSRVSTSLTALLQNALSFACKAPMICSARTIVSMETSACNAPARLSTGLVM